MSQVLVKQIELISTFWNINFLKNLYPSGHLESPEI